MRGVRRTALVSFAGLALIATAASGCGSGSSNDATPTPAATGSATASSPAASSATGSSSGSASLTPSGAGTTTATPTFEPLDWTKLPGDGSDPVTADGPWSLTVDQDGGWWSLGKGTAKTEQTPAPQGLKVVDTRLDDDWAVAVYGDENGKKPQQAAVTSLASGKTFTIDESSDLPPSTDGSWALDGDTLWHATDHGDSYCLAATDLASRKSTLGPCVDPSDHGFTNVVAAGGTTSMMTFDDQQPSCRTIVTVSGTTTTPYPGVAPCKGAQGAVLGSGGGASRIWSVVPNENRYQQVRVYASTAGGVVDLGLGMNSSLVVCGSAAYWARDAAGSTPAAIMRWDGSKESEVYESKGFLGQPLCAGHTLSILDSSDSGNQELRATVE